ncbi:MAG TPA: hypothetical protein VEU07_04365, partial [Candidatus Acidoferrum sp.]|nr:hypothetical protein [Candidatus Acidoferrum sp.]
LASVSGCGASQEPVVMPPELVGVWKTIDARYVDRGFELTSDTIILATGEEGKHAYPIQQLEKRVDMRDASYVVTYGNSLEGVADRLSFSYEAREGGVIRFKSQRGIVWKRNLGPPVSRAEAGDPASDATEGL